MPTIKHILFPLDFSDQCQQAVPFVHALASRFKASITLFSAVPPVWNMAPMGPAMAAGIDTAGWTRELEARLDQAFRVEFAGLSVDRVVDAGDPAPRIVRFAEANAVDLIMMPTHGCGLFRSFLPGSITSKVLHDARGPVWTAAHTERQQAGVLPRTILCAIDGTPESHTVMRWAAEFSAQVGGILRLLHVVPPITDWPSLAREQTLQDRVREEARLNVESIQLAAGVDAPLRVAVGSVVDVVAEEARQEGVDLIVVGRGSLSSPMGRLRTHAFGIIQRAPCPVLSV